MVSLFFKLCKGERTSIRLDPSCCSVVDTYFDRQTATLRRQALYLKPKRGPRIHLRGGLTDDSSYFAIVALVVCVFLKSPMLP